MNGEHNACGSDGGGNLPPAVLDLSESSEDGPWVEATAKQGVKRKRCDRSSSRPKRFAPDDPIGLQILLGKPCAAKCKKRCKDLFRSKQLYADLVAFRRAWKGYHKTDQDLIVSHDLLK